MVTKKKSSTTKKNLVIVESPAKAKTIEKYLGRNYKVMASVGHIRDLKKSTMSIDFDNNYEPEYINIRGKGPLINDLKKEAKKAKQVFLASDPDREGEAISWHFVKDHTVFFLAFSAYFELGCQRKKTVWSLTKSPRMPLKMPLKNRAKSIWTWSMPNKHVVSWTGL